MLSWFGGLVLPATFHTFRVKISFVETPLIFFCQPRKVFELAFQLCNWISDQTQSGEVSLFFIYNIYHYDIQNQLLDMLKYLITNTDDYCK